MKALLRFEVFKRDSFTCRYCGEVAPKAILEVDHVHPRALGGTDDLENLVTSCFVCNRGKGARPLDQVVRDPADINERTYELAERELQLESYNYWRRRAAEREAKELDELHALWCSYFKDWAWNEQSAKRFLRDLGVAVVSEAIETAVAHSDARGGSRNRPDDSWRYFCGICWRTIKRNAGDVVE
jgi:hypothetical protein